MPSSLLFDGDNDFVELGSITAGNPLMLNESDLTILAWVKWQTGDGAQRVFDKSTGGAYAGGYGLSISPSASPTVAKIDCGANGNVVDCIAGINGGWMPVSGHIAAAGYRITVWGEEVPTATLAGAPPAQPPNTTANARIGTWNHSTGREFKGNLRDVVVYPGDLTNEQVRQWIKDGTLPGTPAGRWLLEDGSGLTATDETGNNDGTLTNGPSWSADYPWVLDEFGGGGGGRPRIGNIW